MQLEYVVKTTDPRSKYLLNKVIDHIKFSEEHDECCAKCGHKLGRPCIIQNNTNDKHTEEMVWSEIYR